MSTFSVFPRLQGSNLPTYRFQVTAGGRAIKHFANSDMWGFRIEKTSENDARMCDVALGMAVALHEKYKNVAVYVYCMSGEEYRLIHTQR